MILFKAVILGLLMLFSAGCSSSPQETVNDMYSALRDGDILKLNRNVTEPRVKQLALASLKKCSVDKSSYKDNDIKLVEDCFREMYSGIKIKNIVITNVTENKSYATLSIENNSSETTTKEYLLKIDGKWKATVY